MRILFLLLFALQDGGEVPIGRPVGSLGVHVIERVYHRITLAKLATTTRTHIEVCGPVVYVRSQRDGDIHVTLDNGRTRVVAEIIPLIPLPRPRKGQTIRVRGISRYDKGHKFAEVHPVESWERVTAC